MPICKRSFKFFINTESQYVGSGGHVLYGGFGHFSGLRGLLLDQMVSAWVMLANEVLVIASNSQTLTSSGYMNQSFLQCVSQAIRGGDPSFGIVTP